MPISFILIFRLCFDWSYVIVIIKLKIVFDEYFLVVLQLILTSCACYNNNCITKLGAPDHNFSIYTWFS